MISIRLQRVQRLDLQKVVKNLSVKMYVAVGFPKEKQNPYPDGTQVADVAYQNEYGVQSLKIPSRPFMRRAVARNKDKYRKMIQSSVKRIMDGGSSTEKELQKLGKTAQQDIQKEIDRLWYPPLSTRTIKEKGSNKPLIDTGHMRKSVTYQVRCPKDTFNR